MNERKTLVRLTDSEIKKLLTERRDEAISKYKIEVSKFLEGDGVGGFRPNYSKLTVNDVVTHGELAMHLLNDVLLAQQNLDRGYAK